VFVPSAIVGVKNSFAHFKAQPVEKQEDGTPLKDEEGAEHEEAIRCLKISPDGKTLASGDVDGNIRIYDLTVPDDIKLVKMLEAHDREVICLAFSPSFMPAG
jgi:WD40 repeat protein